MPSALFPYWFLKTPSIFLLRAFPFHILFVELSSPVSQFAPLLYQVSDDISWVICLK